MDISTVPIQAARNVPLREKYGLLGEADSPFDLTGCTLKMEVRLYGAQPGAALISLTQAASAAQGIRVVDAPGGVICIQINQPTLEALPGGPTGGTEPNQPDVFVYDLIISPSDQDAEVLVMAGSFAVYPGVTDL